MTKFWKITHIGVREMITIVTIYVEQKKTIFEQF